MAARFGRSRQRLLERDVLLLGRPEVTAQNSGCGELQHDPAIPPNTFIALKY